MLSSFGFVSSYNHVTTYEKCAALAQAICIPDVRCSFFQFIADNVDDNPETLHGYNTMHTMGIMDAMTQEFYL